METCVNDVAGLEDEARFLPKEKKYLQQISAHLVDATERDWRAGLPEGKLQTYLVIPAPQHGSQILDELLVGLERREGRMLSDKEQRTTRGGGS